MIDERIKVRSRWHLPGSPRIARVMAVGEGWNRRTQSGEVAAINDAKEQR